MRISRYILKIVYFKKTLGTEVPNTRSIKTSKKHNIFVGYPVMNDPLYNHTVFGAEKGKGGNIGKSDEKLISDLISIHNAENWLGMDGDSELSMFNKSDLADDPALGSSGRENRLYGGGELEPHSPNFLF